MLKSEYQYRGMHSHTRSNKEFVKLRDQLIKHYRDYQMADKLGIPRSTFSKYKLGYFQPTSRVLVALRMLVNGRFNTEKVVPSKKVSVNTVPPAVTETTVKHVNGKGNKQNHNGRRNVVVNIPAEFNGSVIINVK